MTNAIGTPPARLAAALRHHAQGLHSHEAAAELLIGHATWLHRGDFAASCITNSPGWLDGTELAVIDWPTAITSLETERLPCSDSEASMLRLGASLAHGTPVDLRNALTGLDARNASLVSRAVLHAAGHKQDHFAP